MESFIEEKEDCACYAGQPKDDTKEKLFEAFKEAYSNCLQERKKFRLEKYPDLYLERHDCGYFDNGVGMDCCGYYEEENEELAEEHAQEDIIEGLRNNDCDILDELFAQEDFREKIADILEGGN